VTGSLSIQRIAPIMGQIALQNRPAPEAREYP